MESCENLKTKETLTVHALQHGMYYLQSCSIDNCSRSL